MAAKYSSGQDYLSAAKLNYFHYALKQLTGYLIHPSISTSSNPRTIADLGTQTAIWAIDVAESLPETNIDAFDLSDKFCPQSTWLPGNVTFRVHDICNTFPSDMLGQYDLVHLRLFLTLSEEKLQRIIGNTVTLLNPGGYVQWMEHDKTNLKGITAREGASTEAVDAFIKLQQNPFPGYNSQWVSDIAPAMTSAGLEVVAEDHISTRPSMLSQFHELHLLSLMDVAPGLSAKVDDFKAKYFDDLARDHERGVALVDGFRCVVGRKVS